MGFGVAGKTYAFTASNAQSLYGAGVSVIDAATLTAEGTVVDASADGATSVKIFNWNNFTQLNRVNSAITLRL